MTRKKYFTEEERKEAKRESVRKSYYKNREKRLEKRKQYYQDNKEKELESKKRYYQEHKEEYSKLWKQWYQDNKEEKAEYDKKYRKTPIGRASNILKTYKQSDKKHNRGECTLTAKWIVENIFPKPCIYCGEVGWEIMGCDRINNDLPHTPNNVVPCCKKCNGKRGTKPFEEFLNEMQQKMLEEAEAPL